jgi:hypothetical protein
MKASLVIPWTIVQNKEFAFYVKIAGKANSTYTLNLIIIK